MKPNTAKATTTPTAYSYQPTGRTRAISTPPHRLQRHQKHHLSLVYNYDKYVSIPDFLNNIVPDLPGTRHGARQQRQHRPAQQPLRRHPDACVPLSAPRLTNELRGGLNGGTVLFFDAVAARPVRTVARLHPTFALRAPTL